MLNVRGPWEAYRDHQGLSSRSLGLQLIASRSMFAEVGLKIRCVALLPDSVPGGPHLRQTQEMVYLAPTVILEKLASPVSSKY